MIVDEKGVVKIEHYDTVYELQFKQFIKYEKWSASPLIFTREYDEQFNLIQKIKDESSIVQRLVLKYDSKPLEASVRRGRQLLQITSTQHQYLSCEPTKESWYIYNQNVSKSDLEILYDNQRWLKSNMLDAMANRFNYEIYKKFFDEAQELKSVYALQHVFPTTTFEEMERQYDLKSKGQKNIIDCFQYSQELNFLKPILLKLYSKFYFLINSGNHFFLGELDLRSSILYLYDSLYQRSQHSLRKILFIIKTILCKYDINININIKIQQLQPYPKQQDSINCGIYTIYYLSQLIQDKCLTNPTSFQIDPFEERQKLKQILSKPNRNIRFKQISQINK